jgi:hypothetical protein
MPGSWTNFIAACCSNAAVRGVAMTMYYLAILVGLLMIYGAGDWSTPSFVYQGF